MRWLLSTLPKSGMSRTRKNEMVKGKEPSFAPTAIILLRPSLDCHDIPITVTVEGSQVCLKRQSENTGSYAAAPSAPRCPTALRSPRTRPPVSHLSANPMERTTKCSRNNSACRPVVTHAKTGRISFPVLAQTQHWLADNPLNGLPNECTDLLGAADTVYSCA
ncbi:hypothetical protein BU23DRAFT_660089 [Bimuria novae-zelandiae CBS 107.79]|uniref:Uncharacterized protein n=1 Tax=Bimuria novae-zelandiae CBS 107.79 TaxID=1447943 RepID=A0A6A5VIV8_9PLEO|nr:hypothetical protein BU23DRAFT_660089 [Bimuria novae-zelandiae CBS 107.79]